MMVYLKILSKILASKLKTPIYAVDTKYPGGVGMEGTIWFAICANSQISVSKTDYIIMEITIYQNVCL